MWHIIRQVVVAVRLQAFDSAGVFARAKESVAARIVHADAIERPGRSNGSLGPAVESLPSILRPLLFVIGYFLPEMSTSTDCALGRIELKGYAVVRKDARILRAHYVRGRGSRILDLRGTDAFWGAAPSEVCI